MGTLKLFKVFEPTQIGQMKIKNRFVCPPMVRNYGTEEGFVTQRTIEHYGEIAKGGVGLIIVEGTCIEAPRGRSFHRGLVLDDDRFIPGFAEMARIIHAHGAKVAVQLLHTGASTQVYASRMQPVGPSEICMPGFIPSRELTAAEIRGIVVKFARGAERAKRAGLDGVEIHAAHSYLLAQFLSPAFNKRQDSYGGILENRARFLLEIMEAVRESVGRDFPVWCRINAQEFGLEKGLTIGDAQSIAIMLEKTGADAVHVSGMGVGIYYGYHSGVMYDPPGNFVHLAEAVKRVVHIPVIAVGKLTPELGEEILRAGRSDLVAMGRGLLVDPELPRKLAEGKYEDIRPCIQCRVCSDVTMAEPSGVRCQVNPALGREREYELKPTEFKKRVLIIGGGPAGMEAARVAALRGHEVMLYEKDIQLGGQMVLAAQPPYKTPIQDFTNYLVTQINKVGVKVELGKEVTPMVVDDLKPDAVILAAGVTPLRPHIPGINQDHVATVEDVLRENVRVGQNVAIIGGGMVGCEVADYLSEKGKRVTVLEMLPEIPMGKGITMMTRLLNRLVTKGVRILTNAKCREITESGVAFIDEEDQKKTIGADTVVLAAGSQPNRELCQTIGRQVAETYLVGDCIRPRRILEAVADGFHVARRL